VRREEIPIPIPSARQPEDEEIEKIQSDQYEILKASVFLAQ
jgi:hypothetical protein